VTVESEKMALNVNVPVQGNEKLAEVLRRVNSDEEFEALLRCANVNAIDRLGMSDHGPTHVKIVANIALRILRILAKRGVKMSLARDHEMEQEDSEVAVFLGAMLHDIGMSVQREDHERVGLPIAGRKANEFLRGIYRDGDRAVIASEVLQAVLGHDTPVMPLTLEASVVKVADALDMAEGRARIPYHEGRNDIYAVSAMSIDGITIKETPGNKPVAIEVAMSNSAGIFQIDELLKPKLVNSHLKDLVTIKVRVSATEKPLVKGYEL
jgi:hypothetical protein